MTRCLFTHHFFPEKQRYRIISYYMSLYPVVKNILEMPVRNLEFEIPPLSQNPQLPINALGRKFVPIRGLKKSMLIWEICT